jgi:hypothetical protein
MGGAGGRQLDVQATGRGRKKEMGKEYRVSSKTASITALRLFSPPIPSSPSSLLPPFLCLQRVLAPSLRPPPAHATAFPHHPHTPRRCLTGSVGGAERGLE